MLNFNIFNSCFLCLFIKILKINLKFVNIKKILLLVLFILKKKINYSSLFLLYEIVFKLKIIIGSNVVILKKINNFNFCINGTYYQILCAFRWFKHAIFYNNFNLKLFLLIEIYNLIFNFNSKSLSLKLEHNKLLLNNFITKNYKW